MTKSLPQLLVAVILAATCGGVMSKAPLKAKPITAGTFGTEVEQRGRALGPHGQLGPCGGYTCARNGGGMSF